jgi:hypothetical protein
VRPADNCSSDKGQISQIYRELRKLNPQRINIPMKKWASELNRKFSKKEIQKASKYMKKCSISLTIKEMRIKTTLRFHLNSEWLSSRKQTTSNFGKDAANRNPMHCWWECKLVQPLRKAV